MNPVVNERGWPAENNADLANHLLALYGGDTHCVPAHFSCACEFPTSPLVAPARLHYLFAFSSRLSPACFNLTPTRPPRFILPRPACAMGGGDLEAFKRREARAKAYDDAIQREEVLEKLTQFIQKPAFGAGGRGDLLPLLLQITKRYEQAYSVDQLELKQQVKPA